MGCSSVLHSKAPETYVQDLDCELPGLLSIIKRTLQHSCWHKLSEYKWFASRLKVYQSTHLHSLYSYSADSSQRVPWGCIINEKNFKCMSSLWTVLSQDVTWCWSMYEKVIWTFLAMRECVMRSHLLRETRATYLGDVHNYSRSSINPRIKQKSV